MSKRLSADTTAVTAILALIVLLPVCAFAQYFGTNFSEKTITVYGESIIDMRPDLAYFPMDITTTAPLIEDAYDENQVKVKLTVEKLKNLGIKKEWIQVTDAQPYKIDQYGMGETPVFGVSNIIIVTMPDIDKLTSDNLRKKIYDIAQAVSRTTVTAYASSSPGANKINSELSSIGYYGHSPIVVFGVSNHKVLEQKALKQAIDNAKAEAERLAEVLGVKIKDIIYFYQSYPYSSGCGSAYYQKGILPEGPKTDDPESIKVCASVNMTFSFE